MPSSPQASGAWALARKIPMNSVAMAIVCPKLKFPEFTKCFSRISSRGIPGKDQGQLRLFPCHHYPLS